MAILNDSVLVGGFFFFLSIILAFFSYNFIKNSKLSPRIKKFSIFVIFTTILVIVLLIFEYHSITYMNKFNINAS